MPLLNKVFLLFLVVVLVLPLNYTLFYISELPVDIVLSDLVIVITAIYMMLMSRHYYFPKKLTILVAILCVFCVLLGVIAFFMYDSLTPTVASIRFVKPFIFIYLGIVLSKGINLKKYYDYIVIVVCFMIWTTLFSDIVLSANFPRIRWGQTGLFGLEYYGFPNSAMVLYAFLMSFILPKLLDKIKHSIFKSVLLLSSFCIGYLTVVFSLSRNALLVLTFSTSCFVIWSFINYFFLQRKLRLTHLFFLCFVLAGGFCLLFYFASDILYIAEPLIGKWQHNMSTDFSSGRFEIWYETIMLIGKSPIVGYLFIPFSEFSDFGTPHQQYLEVFYKTGLIGFLLYILLIIYAFKIFLNSWRLTKDNNIINGYMKVQIITFIAILIGSFAQPNLSYFPLGQLIFFNVGLNIAKFRENRHIL